MVRGNNGLVLTSDWMEETKIAHTNDSDRENLIQELRLCDREMLDEGGH